MVMVFSDYGRDIGHESESRFARELMVIHQIHMGCVLAGKLEDNAPVSRYGHRPLAFARPLQGMEPEAWQIHVFRLGADIEHRQNLADPADVLRVDAAMIPCAEKPFKAFMPKSKDHV